MSVKQFSAVYAPIEDRIIFGFNTTEDELYSFILTRAIASSFLDQAETTVEQSLSSEHSERSSKLISEFQKEGLKKQLNFEVRFEGGQITPLGKEPILVTQVHLDLKPDNVAISLTLLSNQVVGFSLLAVQLQALTLLLEKLARQACWKIGSDDSAANEAQILVDLPVASQLH